MGQPLGSPWPQLEDIGVHMKRLTLKVSLVGSTTAGSVTGSTDGGLGAVVYTEAQSLTAPSDANFASLLNSATPTVIGIYLSDQAGVLAGGLTSTPLGRIKQVNQIVVDANSIQSGSMTAGVVTWKGLAAAISGGGRLGVTSNGNLAFQISCTGLKLTAAALNHTFQVVIDYSVL